jgi:thiamine biosynthesis lipoprotein
MKKRLLAGFLLCIILLFCLSACGKQQSYTAYSFDYFDTVTTVVGYASDQEEFDRISGDILSELGEYHRLFTTYHRYEGLENLCTINELSNGAHRTVTVDRRIIDMLLYAREMHAKTGGKVNIAMGSVLSIWHDYRELGMDDPASATLPPMERLREAALHTDINGMVIDEEACTVTLTDPDMRLDVGAIAKGYAVEMVARSLAERGISGYVINVGGNVRTVGTKSEGEPWLVGIENPAEDAENPYLAYLNLADRSLVTSGSYQRYYVVDGERYHHIIDPDTLMPALGYLSVSIVCESSADGDALSTALFCMTPEEGLALIESLPGIDAMWVMPDGTQEYSSGFYEHVMLPTE